jgi:two-component system sensor histidine kinase YesM
MTLRPGSLTLRKRIVIVFTIATLVPFLLTVAVSYATIASIQTNQIQSRIRTNLAEVKLNIENALDNLNHVSQQLTYEGSVGPQLKQYLETKDGFEKATLRDVIKTQMNLVAYTNPNVGLMMYTFDGGTRYDFESSTSVSRRPLSTLPPLDRRNQISYFGPYKSLDNYNGHMVLSVLRRVDSPNHQDISIFLETGFKLTDRILQDDASTAKARFLFLNGERQVVYTELPETFPLGKSAAKAAPEFAVRDGYLWSEAVSKQGWALVSLVSDGDYNRERDRWLGLILVLSVLFVVVGVGLGTLLWRTVYRPLGVFQKEMTWIENLERETQVIPVHIPEFDRLLFQFQEMKGKVLRLIEEGRTKERQRADLEIEKLLFQINPHFLLNALNTVHWLAVVHKQPQIDQFTLSLTKLLSYNLGKLGKLGTLRDEIDALREYVAIQRLRFDLHFSIRVEVPDEVLDTLVPRFTLQPLVENAIHHGLGDDGWIELAVFREDGNLMLRVEDHGPGMGVETAGTDFGMGIGLAYVRRVLDFHFDGRARVETDSLEGRGTRITVVLEREGGS